MNDPQAGKNSSFTERLKKISPLDRLSDEELQSIVDMSQVIQYDAGDTIIRQNEFDNRIYFLIQGEVKVEKDGQAVKVLWETGSVFGEMRVIEGVGRSATVTAQKKTACLSIDAAFYERIKSHGGSTILERIFTEVLAERLRSTTEELSRYRRELTSALEDNIKLRSLAANLKKSHASVIQLIADTEAALHHPLSAADSEDQ